MPICVSVCENLRSVKLFFVLRAEHLPPPTRPPLLPFSSLRSRHLSSLFSFYSPPVRSFFSFGSFCLSLSQDVRMEDGRRDAASLRFMLMPSRLFLPLLSIVLSPFFSGLIFSQRSLHAFTWLSLSNQPAICSPSDLFSSSPLPPSLPTFSLCEELLLKWCSLLCLELCCLSHPFNYQDHPLFLFFPSSIPSFFVCPPLHSFQPIRMQSVSPYPGYQSS